MEWHDDLFIYQPVGPTNPQAPVKHLVVTCRSCWEESIDLTFVGAEAWIREHVGAHRETDWDNLEPFPQEGPDTPTLF
jgi:hypothetical protein